MAEPITTDNINDSIQRAVKYDLDEIKKMLREVKDVSSLADIHYIRQKEPKGVGDAVLKAEKHVGDEPFAVLLGDDIIKGEIPCIKQLVNLFEKYNKPIIAVIKITHGMPFSPNK